MFCCPSFSISSNAMFSVSLASSVSQLLALVLGAGAVIVIAFLLVVFLPGWPAVLRPSVFVVLVPGSMLPPLVCLQAGGPRSVPLCRIVPQGPLRLARPGRPGRFRPLYPPGPVSHHRLPRPRSRSAWQTAQSLSTCARAFTRERNSWSGPMDPDTDSFALPGVGNRRLRPPRPADGGNALRPLSSPSFRHGPFGAGRRAGLPAGGMPPSDESLEVIRGGYAREVAG